ncbi:hypothetical protein ALC56_05627 [Trachymyrmex septentrionalis]|uniref:Uncharacterized protein n=1 Tax=Trachymyrmex septentrionalis TaxID=34720 RepID=A0A195FIP7_9HYME|nr:hypothetical protein ALC56_05627 [Trachymyrmex septentrionalis]
MNDSKVFILLGCGNRISIAEEEFPLRTPNAVRRVRRGRNSSGENRDGNDRRIGISAEVSGKIRFVGENAGDGDRGRDEGVRRGGITSNGTRLIEPVVTKKAIRPRLGDSDLENPGDTSGTSGPGVSALPDRPF